MNRVFDVATAFGPTLIRLGSGVSVGALGARPKEVLELYEFEACPYCRKVREALTILDLDAVIRPCPKGGRRFRPEVKRRGGKAQFPYLIDPNTGKALYESDEIVRTLFAQYGDGRIPLALGSGPLTDAGAALSGLPRLGKGLRAEPSVRPAQLLELYSFEGSPFCRLVREKLCALELPYRLRNVGKGSPRRGAFVKRSGKMMVPYLVDPNTDTEMFESADIVEYVERTYAAAV